MGSCTYRMPDEFLLKISRLAENTDTIVPRVLEAGAEVVFEKVKSNLQAVIGSNTKHDSESTGELVASLGISPVKLNRDNNFDLKIGFNEPRRKQYTAKGKRSYKVITNAMIANVIEHGKHNQPPRPFLKPAKSASKEACTAAMISKLEEEIAQL